MLGRSFQNRYKSRKWARPHKRNVEPYLGTYRNCDENALNDSVSLDQTKFVVEDDNHCTLEKLALGRRYSNIKAACGAISINRMREVALQALALIVEGLEEDTTIERANKKVSNAGSSIKYRLLKTNVCTRRWIGMNCCHTMNVLQLVKYLV